MKRTLLFLAFTLAALLPFSSLIRSGQAGQIGVGTYDVSSGEVKDAFVVGEQVKIKAQSNAKPITIVIKDPQQNVVGSETVNDFNYEKDWTGITLEMGIYTVEASSPIDQNRKNFAITSFQNVVPEVPFGTFTIATTTLIALGFYGFIRRKKQL